MSVNLKNILVLPTVKNHRENLTRFQKCSSVEQQTRQASARMLNMVGLFFWGDLHGIL